MRRIVDILSFRQDISPFLVHLTRNTSPESTAENNLINILNLMRLNPGGFLLDSKNGWEGNYRDLPEDEKLNLFTAICFTETPISEIHCLLEIDHRRTDLTEYGIVFMKDRLKMQNVSPVWYINNWDGTNDDIFYALCDIKDRHAQHKFLPLISLIGRKVLQRGFAERLLGDVDFIWEREWRRPRIYGALQFSPDDIFIGLCPHERIEEFERRFPNIKFIDPKRNMKWYADKLIEARRARNLKCSVV